MHYADIAQEISRSRLRKSNELGATPSNTVAVIISKSLSELQEKSPFARVSRGIYALRTNLDTNISEEIETSTVHVSGIINALGMFWERAKVNWRLDPQILGSQQPDSQPIDFGMQVGIYLLHDSQGVVYVGRTTDQTLGRRLYQHTLDRLRGRWDRFSWFGLYEIGLEGALVKNGKYVDLDTSVIITTLEAVMIEGLEPRQNRHRGDDFRAIEFIQSEDPLLAKKKNKAILNELIERS